MTATRIDHELAKVAANVVPGTVDKELRTRYVGLPHMIMSSGLTATVAFLMDRDKSTARDRKPGAVGPYLKAAQALLFDAVDHAGIPRGADVDATLVMLTNTDDDLRFRLAETRARLLAGWLARIANARRVPEASTESGPES